MRHIIGKGWFLLLICSLLPLVGKAFPQEKPQTANPDTQGVTQASTPKKRPRRRIVTDLSGFDLTTPSKGRPKTMVVGATRGISKPVALAPILGRLFHINPLFHWSFAGRAQDYLFVLRSQNQNEFFRSRVPGKTFRYPATAPALIPGTEYSWTVEVSAPLLGTIRSEPVAFLVATAKERDEINSLLQGKRSKSIARARVFVDQRLWYDAIEALTDLISRDPINPEAFEQRGMVYAQLEVTAKLAEQDFTQADALRETEPSAGQEQEWARINEEVETLAGDGKLTEAYAKAQALLRFTEEKFGPDHPRRAAALSLFGYLEIDRGNYPEASDLFQRALRLAEEVLPPYSPEKAEIIAGLAQLDRLTDKYVSAEQLYNKSLSILQKAHGPEHEDIAAILNQLGLLYDTQGRFGESESLYRRSLAMYKTVAGDEHPEIPNVMNNLATIYALQGNFSRAEVLFRDLLGTTEKKYGPQHPKNSLFLNNLAYVYDHQGNYSASEPLYLRAIAIDEKTLGPDHPDLAINYNNLAINYQEQKKYEKAEPLFHRTIAIREKVLGPDHNDVAVALHNLALFYEDQQEYKKSEPLFLRSNAILEKLYGPEHPRVGLSLGGLAGHYFALGKVNETHRYFRRALDNLSLQFEHQFRYLSEEERLAYLDSVAELYRSFYSFCLIYKDKKPELVGDMYDTILRQKGLVATGITALRRRLMASGKQAALETLDQLAKKRAEIAPMMNLIPQDRDQWSQQVKQAKLEANELERILISQSEAVGEDRRLEGTSWRDILATLQPGDAAVEIVRFQFYDGKLLTQKYYYAALVITSRPSELPKLVVLGEAAALESKPLTAFRRLVSLQTAKDVEPTPELHQAFWKPLEPYLADSKRIFLSPDGIFNVIAWGTIPIGNGEVLLDSYDIRVVSSTRDLLRTAPTQTAPTAALIGNPTFSLSEEARKVAPTTDQRPEEVGVSYATVVRGIQLRDKSEGALPPLPGTKQELREINHLLQREGWKVGLFSEQMASEDSLKTLPPPRLLHIATHGFFLPDQADESATPGNRGNPMLKSGLFFAGVENVLFGGKPASDREDGVLTAFEASTLNLQGTELVVLSTCETGLGQVKNGEGVFGLRRAFQVAGARAVLMSLWSVPDRETRELMTLFYQNWLELGDKRLAFRQAQLVLREQVKQRYGADLPFYWGAFVLVGDG